MLFKLKNLFHAIVFLCICWFSWSLYQYFFDTTQPVMMLGGVTEEGHCAGDVACSFASSKPGVVSVWLDGQPLTNKFLVKKREHEQTFTIPTKTLPNGRHALQLLFVDTTYHKNKTRIDRSFIVDNMPLQAALVKADLEYKVFQGRTLHIQIQVNKPLKQATILALSNKYSCFPESKDALIYETFIPISCEEKPNEYLFSAELVDHVGNRLNLDNKFQVVAYPFKKQMLHISENKIEQERELADSTNLEQAIERVVQQSPQEKLWHGTFCTPIDVQRVTCDFGTVRTTQHKGRYAHKALDVINTPRSVVWTPQDGVVALKQRFETSGNTVVIDHGCGITSLFFHLDSFAHISVGQKVVKGNPIGTIGKTGYATGYHLHWEMRINNVAVDPMQWTKATF